MTPLKSCEVYNTSCTDCLFVNICMFIIYTTGEKRCVDEVTAENKTAELVLKIDEMSNCDDDEMRLAYFDMSKYIHDFKLTKANYNRLMAPTFTSAIQTNVSLGMGIFSVDVDEDNCLFFVNASLLLEWHDNRLEWADKDTAPTTRIVKYPEHEIWLPPVTIKNFDNPKNGSNIKAQDQTLVLVNEEGIATWNRSLVMLESEGDCHYYRYPFDTQIFNVTLTMGDATHGDITDLRLLPGKADLTEQALFFHNKIVNREWSISDWSATRRLVMHECCPKYPFVDLVFSLKMSRRLDSDAIAIIVSVILITIGILLEGWRPRVMKDVTHILITIMVLAFCVGMLATVGDRTWYNKGRTPLLMAQLSWDFVTLSVFLTSFIIAKVQMTRNREPVYSIRYVTTSTRILYYFFLQDLHAQVYDEATRGPVPVAEGVPQSLRMKVLSKRRTSGPEGSADQERESLTQEEQPSLEPDPQPGPSSRPEPIPIPAPVRASVRAPAPTPDPAPAPAPVPAPAVEGGSQHSSGTVTTGSSDLVNARNNNIADWTVFYMLVHRTFLYLFGIATVIFAVCWIPS